MKHIKSTSQDWFNHIAQGITSNALIQYVLKPAGDIDYQRLSKSVMLSIQAEPVLSCIFEENDTMPVWNPVSAKADDICCWIKTQDIEKEIDAFLAKELNASEQIPVMVALISNEESNAIVIKISHSVCDGSGSKYYLQLLAGIYSQLEKDNSYIPPINTPARDTENFYKAMEINDKESFFDEKKAELASSWGFPVTKEISSAQTFSHRELRYRDSEFQNIKQFAKDKGVTINTVLMAAYFKALTKVLKPADVQKELQFMIDLRKYLPQNISQTICNLSGILNIEIPTGNEFDETVKQVNDAVKEMLAQDNFIHGTIAGDLSEDAGYKAICDFIKLDWENIKQTGDCTPMISNLGLLNSQNISFGKTPIKDMYLVSPAFYAPAFMLGISTYNNTLTISAGYYTPGISNKMVKELMQQIDCLLGKTISM